MKPTIRVHVLGATALALILAGPAAASEVEELKTMVRQLQDRLAQLEQRQAEAEKIESAGKSAVESGNDTVRLSISGQVNRGILAVDDGEETDVHHVDNDASSTRIRFIGEVDVSDDLKVGSAIEVQFESNSTADVSQFTEDTGAGKDNFTQRRLEVYFDSKRLGKLWLGQGWTATEGTSEMDLSGTALAGYSDSDILAGGTRFRRSDGTLLDDDATHPKVKDVLTNLDGLGRDDRVRYDSPGFGGFKVSLGTVQGGAWDTALRYSGELANGARIVGALGYADHAGDDSALESQLNGSASVLLPSGFNATLAAGRGESDAGDDVSFYYGKVGYQARLIPAGKTAFSVDYHQTDDAVLDGDEATGWGLQLVQNIDRWGTELYAGYRNYQLERESVDFEDINAVLAGARVKF